MKTNLLRSARNSPVGRGRLPNTIVIGAQKAGTTSLHFYMGLHPEITMTREKELQFFIDGWNWFRGLDWYRSHFTGHTPICGESSPNYTIFPIFPGVAARMYRTVPAAKLIYIVRDPIVRIISHYIHNRWSGNEKRPFNVALSAAPERYLAPSMYYRQLMQFTAWYPLSQIYILSQESLQDDRAKALAAVFRFLDVKDTFSSPLFRLSLHRSIFKRELTPSGRQLQHHPAVQKLERLPMFYRENVKKIILWPFSRPIRRPRVAPDVKQTLVRALGPDVDRFRELTGETYPQWSV